MRIAIDLLIAEKEPGGMLFATRALLAGLAQIDQTNEYIIITSRPQHYQALASAPNMHIHEVKLRSWKALLIQHQLLLPAILRRLQPDMLHIPAFAAPIGWHGPLVVTVHDLACLKVPEQTSFYGRFYWNYLLRESVKRAKHVIAVSEQTRDELISHWRIQPECISIIHNALRPSLRTDIPVEEIHTMQQCYGKRYLLHVGRIMPRKNVETLVQAFDLLAPRFGDLHLVLTGGVGYGSSKVLQQIETSPYRERIHLADWVSDEDLGALYVGASALVFPSKHEGFGLPIVEAMSYGTPVIASPQAASMEIAGEAVLRVDCSTPIPLAEGIGNLLDNEMLREHLIRLGKMQVKLFTVEACTEATLRVYRKACSIDQQSPLDVSISTTVAKTFPYVSVIVPATRAEQVLQTLESISCQHYQGKIEIIVVGLCADELAQQWPITPVNPGYLCTPGRARNLGAQSAKGDVLLFLDDDCTVAEDWVERNVLELQRPRVGAVGARISCKYRTFFAKCTDYTNFGYYQHRHSMNILLAAASMGVTRSVFQSVGGFDDKLRYDEDMDICLRMQKLGYLTVYQPDIVVTHDHRRDTWEKLLHYNYIQGRESGLTTKIRHKQIGLRNRLLYVVRFRPLFLLLLPYIAIAATIGIVAVNIPENWDILLHVPFILAAKLAYEFGIFRWMICPRENK